MALRRGRCASALLDNGGRAAKMILPGTEDEFATLESIERRVLWIPVSMIPHANQ